MDLSQATNIYLGATGVSAVYYGANKIWPSTHDYSLDYFTIEALENNLVIGVSQPGTEYSLDNGTTWATTTSQQGGAAYTLPAINTGDKVLFRNNDNFLNSNNFVGNKQHKAYGNIMSLHYGDNFVGQTIIPSHSQSSYTGGVWASLFREDTYLVNAEDLILPALNVDSECYKYMFYGCTSLVYGPKELPSTTASVDSYQSMFEGCTSLIKGPDILLAHFDSSMTHCLYKMFSGCSSLTYIKCLVDNPDVASYTPSNYTELWVSGVPQNIGTFVRNANASWTFGDSDNYYSGYPNGWTVTSA